jgi:hypothetical protein
MNLFLQVKTKIQMKKTKITRHILIFIALVIILIIIGGIAREI